MNRTIEAWQQVAEARFHGRVLDQAIEDMQELARQLAHVKSALADERSAWGAKRANMLRSISSEQVLRTDAQRQRDELLARIGAAEARLDYALNELEFIANTDSIDAVLDPDRAIRVAKAAVKFIKEQTK